MNQHNDDFCTWLERAITWFAWAVLAAAVVWMAARVPGHVEADILKGANPDTANAPGDGGGLKDFISAIDQIKGPATVAFASLSSVGLLAGGAMTAMGMQSGIRIMMLSALSGAGVLLGNGLVA
jgi:hypothetical protein